MNTDERKFTDLCRCFDEGSVSLERTGRRVRGYDGAGDRGAYKVSNTLGAGFLEKVYENALAFELRREGSEVSQQHPISVMYEGVCVGEFFADLMVDRRVLVEVKAAKGIDPAHVAQCLNYLRATGSRVCLLLNFGRPKLQIKRLVL